MNATSLRKRLLISILGAGIAMVVVLWNMDAGPSEKHKQPQTSGMNQDPDRESGPTADKNSSHPSDRKKQPVITPSDNAKLPSLDEAHSNATGSDETSLEQNKIYAMDTLPQNQSSIYWVRDGDGGAGQVAVDVPGSDLPGEL